MCIRDRNKIEQRFTNDQKAFTTLINTIYERPENKRKINFTKELKKEFGNLIITTKTWFKEHFIFITTLSQLAWD